MDNLESYYDLLEISKTATRDEIKEAFHKLAHQYHPDKNSTATEGVKKLAEEKFKEVKEAYEILGDQRKRKLYDAKLKEFETKQQQRQQSHNATPPPQNTSARKSNGWSITFPPWLKKPGSWFWLVMGVILLFSIFSSGGSADTTPVPTNSTVNTNSQPYSYTPTNTFQPTTSNVKTPPVCSNGEVLNADQTACITQDANCSSQWSNSVWDGSKCTCTGDYEWNPSQTACVTAYAYCPEKYSNSVYSATTNTCTCPSGNVWNSDSTVCEDPLQAKNDSCNSAYPNSEYLKPNSNTGGDICDCKSGFYWNSQRTACYSELQLTQACISSWGTGGYYQPPSYGNTGGCDCAYGYSWNNTKTSCVTTASINQICELDVGRNSYYLGTVSSDGKYNCSNAY